MQIRRAWETTSETGAQIATRFGIPPGTIASAARRNGWHSLNSPRPPIEKPRTLFERCDALHAEIDRVRAACHLPPAVKFDKPTGPRLR